ncbi:hypothetical protein OAV21_02985 [bacterium]|jgi:hypothetical protein|nr:hypothetical protein [Verrucomicrobiales bacterium]MDC3255339.1 hypothetical protein [bacterium]MDF1787900.1 hypothetical protein [Verrucomicrobiales bacterium]NCF92993.1 hypothetical protein [Verrucomicrobiaceae bacterium]
MNPFDLDSFLKRIGSNVQRIGSCVVSHPAETVHLHAIPLAELAASAATYGLRVIQRANSSFEFIRRPISP